MADDHRVLRRRLRVLRAERGWTQTDVAKRLHHISKYRFWQIENGHRLATPEERKLIAKLFDTSPLAIFPYAATTKSRVA